LAHLGVHPASIDAATLTRQASTQTVRNLTNLLRDRYKGRRVLLGVDRLDYTKGIAERLRAIETLAHRRPDLLRDAVYVQIAVPTRQNVPEYRHLRRAIGEEVHRINRALHPILGRNIIDCRHEHLDRTELIAHYATADIALVTPLRDGMNLVAKEYAVTQAATGGNGALVLSRHAGAATQLGDHAILCDPFDPTSMADAVIRAVDLPPPQRRYRIAAMGHHIASRDSQRWVNEILADVHRRSPDHPDISPVRSI
jgi:trehalose-6-phosphate synthase